MHQGEPDFLDKVILRAANGLNISLVKDYRVRHRRRNIKKSPAGRVSPPGEEAEQLALWYAGQISSLIARLVFTTNGQVFKLTQITFGDRVKGFFSDLLELFSLDMIGHGLFYTTAGKRAITDSERRRMGQHPQEIRILFRRVYYLKAYAVNLFFGGQQVICPASYAAEQYFFAGCQFEFQSDLGAGHVFPDGCGGGHYHMNAAPGDIFNEYRMLLAS